MTGVQTCALPIWTPVLAWLAEQHIVQKNRALSTLSGSVIEKAREALGVWFILGPGKAEFIAKADSKTSLQWSLMLARRIGETGSPKAKTGDYRYTDDLSDIVEEIKHSTSKSPFPVAIDLETVGLVAFDPDCWIVSVQVSTVNTPALVVPFPYPTQLSSLLREQLTWLLNDPRIALRGANLKFDLIWMAEKWGLYCSNFSMDTMLVGSILDENRSNSLNTHTKSYVPEMGGYDDGFNSEFNKGKMQDVLREHPSKFLVYAGGDTEACLKVSERQKGELLRDPQLTNLYVNLIHPAARVFEDIERRGVLVDREEYAVLRKELIDAKEEAHNKALSCLTQRVKIKHRENLVLSRDVIVKDFLFSPIGLGLQPFDVTPKTRQPSAAADHLRKFLSVDDARPFIEPYLEYVSINKMLGTYVDGFLKHICSDGKFHPNYFLGMSDAGGTVSGRLSAKNPAIQTLPNRGKWAKPLRRAFVPPPGYGIIQPDFSQGELRITACVANEPTMLDAYRKGVDMHVLTAAETSGISYEKMMTLDEGVRSSMRYGAKALNFGLLYGMSPPGLVKYALKNYGVVWSDAEGEAKWNRFFEVYEALPTWHRRTSLFAHKNFYVRSPLGRIRHLPLINSPVSAIQSRQERQGVNFEIQSTLSDICLLAMVILKQRYPDLWIFLMNHDALAMYVLLEHMEEMCQETKDLMENLPIERFGWKPQIPLVVDVEASTGSLSSLVSAEELFSGLKC